MLVWVIDDNAELRRVFQRAIERGGASFRGFANGTEVMETSHDATGDATGDATDGDRPGLIFVDVLMGEMDGVELAEQLIPPDQRCPIYFMTGGPTILAEAARSIAEMRHLNVQGVLQKPVPLAEIDRIVKLHTP